MKKRIWFFPTWIDLLLLGIAVALFATGAVLLRTSPKWWSFYLSLLDVRVWPPWKCIGLVVVLVESVIIMRCWPNRKQKPSARTESHE